MHIFRQIFRITFHLKIGLVCVCVQLFIEIESNELDFQSCFWSFDFFSGDDTQQTLYINEKSPSAIFSRIIHLSCLANGLRVQPSPRPKHDQPNNFYVTCVQYMLSQWTFF